MKQFNQACSLSFLKFEKSNVFIIEIVSLCLLDFKNLGFPILVIWILVGIASTHYYYSESSLPGFSVI
jgi:hypothetical protein